MPKIADDIIAAAQAAEAKWKIPASISLAQWALESGWGHHMPPDSNNPFGMKARPGDPSVSVQTREVDQHGHDYYITAPFRRFASIAEAFDLHASLLATAPVYAPARACLPDANAFADALTGRYATDPTYGKALRAIMQGWDLYQYNAAPVTA
jgi:flagellum-specific peptidoglycan hydrolase FlgJ